MVNSVVAAEVFARGGAYIVGASRLDFASKCFLRRRIGRCDGVIFRAGHTSRYYQPNFGQRQRRQFFQLHDNGDGSAADHV